MKLAVAAKCARTISAGPVRNFLSIDNLHQANKNSSIELYEDNVQGKFIAMHKCQRRRDILVARIIFLR